MIYKPQQGFTLLELMIAISLGLLIVAAGTAIFINAQRSLGLHTVMSDLRQNANFGLSMITKDIRNANLNMPSNQLINDQIVGSGIVFSKENFPIELQEDGADYISGIDQDIGATEENSDRLTIQFRPSLQTVIDCEGNEINDANTKVIVQRYFIKSSSDSSSGYGLYCDAGTYPIADPTEFIDLSSTDATLVMTNIDAFKIRLLVKNSSGDVRYMHLQDYLDTQAVIRDENSDLSEGNLDKLLNKVISLELGILVRSSGKVNLGENANVKDQFDLAGSTVTFDEQDEDRKKYLYQVINQVVALRNTLGA